MVKRAFHDVRRLSRQRDIDLDRDAPPWLRTVRLFYDIALLGAALLSVYLLIDPGAAGRWANWAIWAWFAIDYAVRLYVADDRADYVRRHRLELLAALPLDFVRPARLLRLLRPIGMIVRATRGLRDVLGIQGVGLVAAIAVATVLGGAAVFRQVEPESAETYADAVWWSVVTTTTVGYGDISPSTAAGRVVAGVLMVCGIGLLGGLTGEFAQRWTRARPTGPASTGDADVDHVIGRLQGWESLDAGERRRLVNVLQAVVDSDHVRSNVSGSPTANGSVNTIEAGSVNPIGASPGIAIAGATTIAPDGPLGRAAATKPANEEVA